MPFLSKDFVVPAIVDAGTFRLRPITIHDAFRDYDAVMSSREHLWARFGDAWGWPAADLSLEQNIVDLGWHQKEFQLRSSFDYVVASRDGTRQLGCVYVDPPDDEGVDAGVWFWARASELASGLEDRIAAFLPGWLADAWSFRVVDINGRRTRLPDPSKRRA